MRPYLSLLLKIAHPSLTSSAHHNQQSVKKTKCDKKYSRADSIKSLMATYEAPRHASYSTINDTLVMPSETHCLPLLKRFKNVVQQPYLPEKDNRRRSRFNYGRRTSMRPGYRGLFIGFQAGTRCSRTRVQRSRSSVFQSGARHEVKLPGNCVFCIELWLLLRHMCPACHSPASP